MGLPSGARGDGVDEVELLVESDISVHLTDTVGGSREVWASCRTALAAGTAKLNWCRPWQELGLVLKARMVSEG